MKKAGVEYLLGKKFPDHFTSWSSTSSCFAIKASYKISTANTFLCELSPLQVREGELTDRQMVFAPHEEIKKIQIQKILDKNTFFCKLSAAACARGGGSWLTDRWCLLWLGKYFPATLTRTHLANFSFVKSLSYQVIKIRSQQVLLLKV